MQYAGGEAGSGHENVHELIDWIPEGKLIRLSSATSITGAITAAVDEQKAMGDEKSGGDTKPAWGGTD